MADASRTPSIQASGTTRGIWPMPTPEWRVGFSSSGCGSALHSIGILRKFLNENFLKCSARRFEVRHSTHADRFVFAQAAPPSETLRPERHDADAVRRNLLFEVVEVPAKAVGASGRIDRLNVDADE